MSIFAPEVWLGHYGLITGVLVGSAFLFNALRVLAVIVKAFVNDEKRMHLPFVNGGSRGSDMEDAIFTLIFANVVLGVAVTTCAVILGPIGWVIVGGAGTLLGARIAVRLTKRVKKLEGTV